MIEFLQEIWLPALAYSLEDNDGTIICLKIAGVRHKSAYVGMRLFMFPPTRIRPRPLITIARPSPISH
ncbi:MAG TPA: hypothetical protein VN843_00365, partial [Anaerolineales bacterium]|nr:hypothetical protein [Anaerolineales bacterium]